jgi:DNA repair protein RadC
MDYVLIRDLPPEERPRERLERLGAAALDVPSLLAILLRTGNARTSALQLGQLIYVHFRDLRTLAAAGVAELSQIPGVGLAKACQILAAFELGKRLAAMQDRPKPVISNPESAANLVREEMRCFREEHFRVLCLDTRNQVLSQRDVSIGTLNASLVHPREVFREAIASSAAAVIVMHNHPSGDPTPSKEDLALTTRLVEAGALLGIPVLDHLIIGERHVSLKERGLM